MSQNVEKLQAEVNLQNITKVEVQINYHQNVLSKIKLPTLQQNVKSFILPERVLTIQRCCSCYCCSNP